MACRTRLLQFYVNGFATGRDKVIYKLHDPIILWSFLLVYVNPSIFLVAMIHKDIFLFD